MSDFSTAWVAYEITSDGGCLSRGNFYLIQSEGQAMANIKSQIKRNRQNEKRRGRNRATRSEINSRMKNALDSAETGENHEEALRTAIKKIDKAVAKNVLHKNTAARRKSRLVRRYNDLV